MLFFPDFWLDFNKELDPQHLATAIAVIIVKYLCVRKFWIIIFNMVNLSPVFVSTVIMCPSASWRTFSGTPITDILYSKYFIWKYISFCTLILHIFRWQYWPTMWHCNYNFSLSNKSILDFLSVNITFVRYTINIIHN